MKKAFNIKPLYRNIGITGIVTLMSISPPAFAQEKVTEALNTVVETHDNSAQSQQRINELDEKTASLLHEYRHTIRQNQNLEVYNQQLEKLVDSQLAEVTSLQQQLKDIEVTQQEITPLMLRMIKTLEDFVALDVPFLPEERQQRLTQLRTTLDRADVTISEKFRLLLEAYQIENDYGRTIEAYRGELKSGTTKTVDFLRIGRVVFIYQTLDGQELAQWDQSKRSWQPLEQHYQSAVNKGLRIARKQRAPELLMLPVSAPVEASQSGKE